MVRVVFLPADLVTMSKSNLLADLWSISKATGRNVGGYLPLDFLTVTKSTGRFTEVRNSASKNGKELLLPANYLTITKSAGRNGGYFC